MTGADRWTRVERILDEILDLPSEDRRARLEVLAAGDPELRAEVAALLDEGERAGGVLDGSLESVLDGVLGDDAGAYAAGRMIGPYRVLGGLGRGGMGEVLLAERADGAFEYRVALKLVRSGLHRGDFERLRHERQILARLRHPNIASLYDGGATDDGAPYFAMEVVEGDRITDFADRERLDVDARVRLFESVCAAVAYAHRNLVVHRDLKPANVLVTADGTVKLLDFGIAKIVDPEGGDEAAHTTHALLTPAYASPEHLRGQPTTTATDVYSLGVLLYELLSGQHPHGDTSSSAEVVRAILEDEPRDPSAVVTSDTRRTSAAEVARRRSTVPAELRRRLRGDLDTIVARALRKSPEERYASVDDLRADLERFRRSLPVVARPATAGYRVRKFVRRNRVAVGTGLVLLFALVVFAVSMSLMYARSQANLARALEAEEAAAQEAETARQVSDFMTDVFRMSNPNASTWEQLTAREILERATVRIETELADQPLVRARLLGSLGSAHTGLGRYTEARRLHEQSLALKRRVLGEDHLEVAQALHNYANLLRRMAETDSALAAYRRALAIREAALGPDHADVAETLTSLGVLYNQIGELDSSLACQERALAIKTKTLGPDHEAVGTSNANLAWLHLRRNLDHAKARVYFDEAHRIYAATYGESHARTVGVLAGIAMTRRLAGDAEGAATLQRRVVELQESVLGSEHPDLGKAIFQLAMMESALGRDAEARALAERALQISEGAYGMDHPEVAAVLGGLADLLAKAGEWDRARAIARRGLDILERARLRTPVTMEALTRLGTLERSRGDEAAAVRYFERALALAEAIFGPDHAAAAKIRAQLTSR